MSEDSRSAKPRKFYYVANPDNEDLYSPSRTLNNMRPPLAFHRPTPSHPPEVSLPILSLPYPQPPLSPDSTGSPSTSTPPPTTPAHSHSTSVDLQPRLDSPSKPLPTPEQIPHHEPRAHQENPPQNRSRKFFTNFKPPFGGRPKPADNSARKLRTVCKSSVALSHNLTSPPQSPTAAIPDSTVASSTSSSSPEKVIFVTSDRERYVTVDISSAKNALQIRELILTKLNIYDDDELYPYAIYKTEISSFAIGEALSNERLFNLCRDLGDAKGNLKFYVSQSSVPVNSSSTPSVEYSSIPHVLPPLPATNPLRIKRRTSRSRNGSVSSTSESTPLEGGYDADGENPQHRETSRPPARTSQSQGASVTSEHPPSPPRRPSLPQYPRPSSPRSSQPEPLPQPPQPSQLFDWQRPSRKDEKYGHAPLPPIPTGSHSLSPNRPSFPLNEDTPSLSVTQDRHLHARSASDAAPEQQHAPKAAEFHTQTAEPVLRPVRSRENPSLTKLRPELSRDNMRERAAKQTYDEEDNSWEIVMPTTRLTDEPSPLGRSRQPNRYNKPTSPFNGRPIVYGSSRPTPSSVSTTTLPLPLPLQSEPPRPSMQSQLRAGRWPVSPNVLVSWKGEEGSSRKPSQTSTANATSSWQNTGSRLNKSTTKSMDSLRSLNHTTARRNPPPALPVLTRPQTSPFFPNGLTNTNLSISGTPKSYEPPRTGMIRPLPHGPSASDHHTSSSSGHSGIRGHNSSSLVNLNHDPYPRPQSAAGDATYSPSSSRRMQSPTYGTNLDSGEFNRSPRTVSPSRPFHSPGIGIPGPRPRPNHHSDRSDRSSASGPETVNTSPPHTPISPQSSTRYESSENGNAVAELSPPSSPDTSTYVRETGSDLTLKQEDQAALKKMLNGWDQETYVSKAPAQQTRSFSPPIPENNFSTDSYLADDDEEEGGSGGTWIVRPEPMQMSNRPPLTVHIENPTNPPSPDIGSSTTQATARPAVPPKDPPPSSYRSPAAARLLSSTGRPESTFIDPEGDNWARPPPENIYEHLEKFFPTHDLDKPVIEATASGDTSPTSSVPPAGMIPPPIPATDGKTTKMKAKKSIRIVAQEHKKLIDRTSRAAEHTAYADNMKRKRSTKLWGSKLEEVTTARSASSSSLPESPSSGPGPTTFKWVRGELIGKGTYGRVYLALNATTGEMIAVKQVELPQTPSDKNDSRQHTVVQALKMESETLRDLDHPHVVQYLGFEETPANLSIFLEYVPGGSVGSCLHKHGRFNDNVTRSFTAQILSGLEYLHSKGILHRDLKADNILVEMSGTCKISDFGISKRTEDLQGGAFTAMQGTVFWMAPEVINTQGKGYNFKIDIWSVGCVVLEMWAGIRPWSGEEMVAVMFKLYQSKQPPPVPEDITPLLPEADDFRLKCFAINPDDRPSAAELRKHSYLILPPGWVFTEFT